MTGHTFLTKYIEYYSMKTIQKQETPEIAWTCAECQKSLVKGVEPIYVIEAATAKSVFYLCKPCVKICAARAVQ